MLQSTSVRHRLLESVWWLRLVLVSVPPNSRLFFSARLSSLQNSFPYATCLATTARHLSITLEDTEASVGRRFDHCDGVADLAQSLSTPLLRLHDTAYEIMDSPEEMAADNPAMAVPASQVLSRVSRHDASKPDHHEHDSAVSFQPSEPAGDDTTALKQTISRPTKYDVGWRRVVRNFSPSWFSVTMGTGIVSLLLITIPFQARWLYWLSVIFFCLNVVLFFLAFSISVLRYTLYPRDLDSDDTGRE